MVLVAACAREDGSPFFTSARATWLPALIRFLRKQ
jgi:hypothetical protein